MAIEIIATVNASDANSYNTIGEMTAYYEASPYRAWWEALDADAQKELAVYSTINLDNSFDFVGRKSSSTQSLAWGRSDVYDKDGYEIASDEIPVNIKYAQNEMAYFISVNEGSTQDNSIKKAKVGSLEVEYKDGLQTEQFTNSEVVRAVGEFGESKSSGNFNIGKY